MENRVSRCITVTTVIDGEDGAPGAQGDAAAEAYVSPGSISVPCNNAGGVVAQVTKTLTFSMRVGTNVATITGVSVETLPAGVSIAAGSSAATKNITIGTTASASGMAAGVTFTITGSYGGKTYMATCTLALIGSKQGDNGEAAYTVKIEPADILFTQSTTKNSQGAYPLVDATKTATVTVKKGNSNDAVAHNTTIQGTPSGCTASVSGDIITVTGVIGNYTEGSVTVRVAITNGPTFYLKLNVYYNLLGSWKEKVEGDTKTEVATSLSYAYIQDGQGVQTLEQIGTYTKSSTENISTLTKKVDNGKNLFSGVLTGNGWRSESSDTFPTHQIVPVTVDDDGYMVSTVTNSHISSPLITLDKGVDYAFSFEGESTGSATVYIFDPAHYQDQPVVVTTTTGTRKTATFKIAGTGTISVYINTYIGKLRYPQLEVGTTATAFVSGDTEITSRIKQMADEIELLVQDTGVDITNGKINLYADKVKFYKNKASATAGDPAKIWIDGSKGTLHAVDGEFEGTVKATSGRVNSLYIGEGVSDSEARIYMKADETTSGSQTKTPLIYGKDSSGNVVFRLGPAVDQPGGAAGTVFSGLAVGYAWISSGGFTVSNPNANQHYAGMAPGAIQLQYPLAGGGTAYARIEMTGDGLKIYSQSWPTENQVSSGCVYKDTNGYLRVKS